MVDTLLNPLLQALERWPVAVMDKLLPRHSEIIKRIDNEWRAQMEERYASMKVSLLAFLFRVITTTCSFNPHVESCTPLTYTRTNWMRCP